jgi:hypothetical protein
MANDPLISVTSLNVNSSLMTSAYQRVPLKTVA